MDKFFSPIKERVIKYIDYKNISKEKFFNDTGISASNFKGSGAKSELGGEKIVKILSCFPDINSEWLLTGQGEMIKSPKAYKEPEFDIGMVADTPVSYIHGSKKGIPLIPIEAMAGFGEDEMEVMEYDCERYDIPLFKGADFLIPIKGSSMYPKYSSGDIVACKKLPVDTFFQWNKVYVLDTVQGALIKRVKRGCDNDHILIVSENDRYEPFELHRFEIRSVAIVIGVIRAE